MEYNNELICSGILNLVKKAKKSGGDRYCGTLTNLGSKTNSIIDIYVPQLISRKSESVVQKLLVKICVRIENGIADKTVIDEAPKEHIIEVNIEKPAKSTGGDKYSGMAFGSLFNIYIPQCFTRYSIGKCYSSLTVAFKHEAKRKLSSTINYMTEAKENDELILQEKSVKLKIENSELNELTDSYFQTYSTEALRLLASPLSFSKLSELIKSGKLELLGRSREQHDTYINFLSETKKQWESVSDYILSEKIGMSSNIIDGKKIVLRPFESSYIGKVYLLKNDFPYHFDTGMTHYCLWKIEGQVSEEDIHQAITDLRLEKAGQAIEFVYYVNPPHLKSIPDIDHAHIISYQNILNL